VKGFFQDRVSGTICPGWLRTMILLISAFCIARITGISHQHPAWPSLLQSKHSTAWATRPVPDSSLNAGVAVLLW
jgi:hypothetical protein